MVVITLFLCVTNFCLSAKSLLKSLFELKSFKSKRTFKAMDRCIIIDHLRRCLRHSASVTYLCMLPSASVSASCICRILTNLRGYAKIHILTHPLSSLKIRLGSIVRLHGRYHRVRVKSSLWLPETGRSLLSSSWKRSII